MGRRRKSLQEHLLNGTYRADRHGPMPDSANGYTGMYAQYRNGYGKGAHDATMTTERFG